MGYAITTEYGKREKDARRKQAIEEGRSIMFFADGLSRVYRWQGNTLWLVTTTPDGADIHRRVSLRA